MSSSDLPSFLLMQNPIQGYDWGSHDSLTTLFGIPNPQSKPQAELWMGAHPNGCSEVTLAGSAQKLSTLIDAAPAAALGDATLARFGSLPFLFKVLCAEKALSIQVHPSKAQAEAGFAKEEAAGIDIKAANRNYKDPNHKPELVFALTPYQAMNGFRAIPAILALFDRMALPALADLTAALRQSQDEAGLQHFFHQLLILCGESKDEALAGLLAYAANHQDEETFALITSLATQYPGDVGLFSPLLLNVVTLQPGQAMFLDACTPTPMYAARVSRSWPTPTTCCAPVSPPNISMWQSCWIAPAACPNRTTRSCWPPAVTVRCNTSMCRYRTSPSASIRRASISSPLPAPRSCLPSMAP